MKNPKLIKITHITLFLSAVIYSKIATTEELKEDLELTSDNSKNTNNISLIFGALSKHINATTYVENGVKYRFNENNPAVGLSYNSWSLVYAKLSYYNHGLAGYYTYKTYKSDDIDLGFRIGAVLGYKNTPINTLVLPLFSPVLEYKPSQAISLETSAMIGRHGIVILMLNTKYNF